MPEMRYSPGLPLQRIHSYLIRFYWARIPAPQYPLSERRMQTRKVVSIANELVGVVETASQQLRLLQETEVSLKPAPGKWSKKEILGHLIDSATNNHQRFVRTQMTEELIFP